jgi:hypothetical protein
MNFPGLLLAFLLLLCSSNSFALDNDFMEDHSALISEEKPDSFSSEITKINYNFSDSTLTKSGTETGLQFTKSSFFPDSSSTIETGVTYLKYSKNISLSLGISTIIFPFHVFF